MCENLVEEWQELAGDYKQLEEANDLYLKKLTELTTYQEKCRKHIQHQRYRIGGIKKSLAGLDGPKKDDLRNKIKQREIMLQKVEQTLPQGTSKYLRVVLGDINVSFVNKDVKFKYKDDYEKFKLTLNIVAFVLAVLNICFVCRPLELVLLFLLVWYYCTVSIRESILKVNGSKIKGWWRIHHILSTIAAGLLLVWPESDTWDQFRKQFMWYNIYNTLLQFLQFKYQRGALYRLKALGERDNMDITIEGFHSWMWKGLRFMLPFLFGGYFYQLYNSLVLYQLSYHPHATYHVGFVSWLFFVFFVGNTVTTLKVVRAKYQDK